jgi:hypothetical protein
MGSQTNIDTEGMSRDISEVVGAVRALGERARYLAVNLAVAAAKLKQTHAGTARLNEDLLDLVARVTRVSQEVSDAVAAIEQGMAHTHPSSPANWTRWLEVGVPDERTLERLSVSLNEALDLARFVFRWLRDHQPTESPRAESPHHPELPGIDGPRSDTAP